MNSKSKLASIFLFLCWPLFTLVLFAQNFRARHFQNIIWIMFVFYGFVMIKSIVDTDINWYAETFKLYSSLEANEKWNYFKDGNALDYFRPITFYLVSFISTSPHFYVACIGLVFGFFYSRIFGSLISDISTQGYSFIIGLILLNFAFTMNFSSLQFIRFSTATLLFVYFVIRYFKEGNSIWMAVGTTLSLLIHFSFLFPVICFFVYIFIPKRVHLFFIAYIVSSSITFFDFSALKEVLETYMPVAFESKNHYLNEDYAIEVEESISNVNWYIKYRGVIMNYLYIVLVWLYLQHRNKINLGKNYHLKMLSFALFFGSLANIGAVIPSGFRFLAISNFIGWFILTYFLTIYIPANRSSLISKLILLVLIFNIVVGLRFAFDTVPISFFISNPILVIIFIDDMPVIDFIKDFLS